MAQAAATDKTADTRNLHWKQNNVGSTLLQKMGWKQGQAIGSKRLQKEEETTSSEGLKIVKRPDGLGLGASAGKLNKETTGHDTFHELLQNLKKDHPPSVESSASSRKKRKSKNDNENDKMESSCNKKKKKKKETIIFASNRMTHARVRQAKFAVRNPQDMACIFGKDHSAVEMISAETPSMVEQEERKLEKKKRKEAKKAVGKETKETPEISTGTGSDKGERLIDAGNEKEKREKGKKRKEDRKRKRREKQSWRLRKMEIEEGYTIS